MTQPKAVIAFSFGGSPGRPGPSNQAFGQAIERVRKENRDLVVIVQDFIGPCVSSPCTVVNPTGKYYTTEQLTDEEILPILKQRGISHVLLVAHPFLHRTNCVSILKSKGLTVEKVPLGWVPFDPECEYWWVRSPFHIFIYAVLAALFGRHGH